MAPFRILKICLWENFLGLLNYQTLINNKEFLPAAKLQRDLKSTECCRITTFIKRKLQHNRFLVNFVRFFRTAFLQNNTSVGCI